MTESLGFNFSLIIKLLFTYTPQETRFGFLRPHTATHCNTLQHTATNCNTLQHTATHCNTLQHTATHCNTLQLERSGHETLYLSQVSLQCVAVCCSVFPDLAVSLQCVVVCCRSLCSVVQCDVLCCLIA